MLNFKGLYSRFNGIIDVQHALFSLWDAFAGRGAEIRESVPHYASRREAPETALYCCAVCSAQLPLAGIKPCHH